MVKVVYNACFGRFGLSDKAVEYLREKHGMHGSAYALGLALARHDPRLVEVVEALGTAASGMSADLKIGEISGTQYRIDEYDGNESIDTPGDLCWVEVEP
jgi:hypothetical protein